MQLPHLSSTTSPLVLLKFELGYFLQLKYNSCMQYSVNRPFRKTFLIEINNVMLHLSLKLLLSAV